MTAITPLDIDPSSIGPTDRLSGKIKRGQHQIPFDVPGYEFPVLVNLHGPENILLDEGVPRPDKDAEFVPQDAWERLLRKYNTKDGLSVVYETYPSQAMSLARNDSRKRKPKSSPVE